MASKRSVSPAPAKSGSGEQKDDNIDDYGRHDDGSVEEQPVDPRKSENHPKKPS